jgi:glycosyltransferase involved in cell wall biosynthesis
VRVWKRLRQAAIFFDVWRGYRQAGRIVRQHPVDLVHARSFVPGCIGLLLKRRKGIPLLYDMRGFWAAEKFYKGTIRSEWVRDRLQAVEDRLFQGADALVSLTVAGRDQLRSRGIRPPIEVIPTCVDTRRFLPAAACCNGPSPRLISVGSLGRGYLPDAVLGFFRQARQHWLATELKILTSTPRPLVEAAAAQAGCSMAQIHLDRAAPDEVPGHLQAADVGLCFIQPGDAKIASCPTKLGEYLACGLPVVANAEVGDVEAILREHRVGVVVGEFSDAALREAVSQLAELLQDPDLGARCRRTAEMLFSLEKGVEAYLRVYGEVVGR